MQETNTERMQIDMREATIVNLVELAQILKTIQADLLQHGYTLTLTQKDDE